MAQQDAAGATELRLHLLVLRCQAGDERAFAQLYEGFAERSLRYLRGLVGDAADDVHQEVWLKVYRNIVSLGKPTAFRTWLFSTTRHRALDFLRRQKRERELLEGAADDLRETTDDAALEPSVDAALDGALAQLSPLHREVLLLRYRDDMSYGEIALV